MPLPLSSFDPRFKELLLRGSKEKFQLRCETRSEAIALRHRIQSYRSQAKRHFGDLAKEEWEPLYTCKISLEAYTDGTAALIFIPRSQEFDTVLSGVPQAEVPKLDTSGASLLDQLEQNQKKESE